MLGGIFQVAPPAAALADIRRRPVEEIRGNQWLWSVAAGVNLMGIDPIASLALGRKHA